MRVSVLGCGRWGTFLAWYANHIGHEVLLWGREGSKKFAELEASRKNEYLVLPEAVMLTQSLPKALDFADRIILSISSQQLRSFGAQLLAQGNLTDKICILCMKGLEIGTGKRLSTVLAESIGADKQIAVWVGPGHVQDFTRGIPNCMVIGSQDPAVTEKLVEEFSSSLIRFYYGEDLLGIEIGAAAKNVIGIAAGMLDGLGCSSLKGALMARGTAELSRIIAALGGDPMTVYGLSHLGDYEATLFSPHSNNRRFGENWVKQVSSDKLAEGVYTVEALLDLSREAAVDLPICRAVYEIIVNHKDAREQLFALFLRPLKAE